jgi:hypothetical protein
VIVGVLQEAGVHLHLAGQHRFELIRHLIPRRDLGMTGGELGIRGYDSKVSFRVIASGAFVFGRNELFPGADVSVSVMLPIPTEW